MVIEMETRTIVMKKEHTNQTGEKLSYTLFNSSKVKQQEAVIKDKAIEVIKFLNLSNLTQELAGNLSG
ncbi:MAG: ABC transporter ATP-binding protein, partial [Rhodospirillaceae bacterium]|nr:ABC transporter ATP-binding protein [Rhodospirillaceae bacterium]